MMSPATLRSKVAGRWKRGQILRAWLGVEALFPLRIGLGRPPAATLLNDYAAVRAWKAALESGAGAYRLEMVEINHRQLGRQHLPAAAVFDTVDDLVAFIGKQNALQQFARLHREIIDRAPALEEWLQRYPIKALQQAENWSRLLMIVDYFKAHPRPGCYLRELDIPGVDTKFIERHKGLLTELLDIVLPDEVVDVTVTGLTRSGFERRFGLKYDEPLIRFRILDPDLPGEFGGLDDLTIPLSRFAALDPGCERVFITENKINGLSFPPHPRSIVIFGLGYGIAALREVGWLATRQIHYWGDIDSHGFAILSQLRRYFPRLQSLLMDQMTLEQFRTLWVREDPAKRTTVELPMLTPAESELYQRLSTDHYGDCVRLEQERIDFGHLRKRLDELGSQETSGQKQGLNGLS